MAWDPWTSGHTLAQQQQMMIDDITESHRLLHVGKPAGATCEMCAPEETTAMTETYIPEPGHLVRIQRWEVPCPEIPGTCERRLLIEIDGTVETVRELAGGRMIHLAGDTDSYFTGYQFTGTDSNQGPSWSLVTTVTRRVWVSVTSHRARAKLAGLLGDALGPEYRAWPRDSWPHGEYYKVDDCRALYGIKGLRVLAGSPRVGEGGKLRICYPMPDGPQSGAWPVPAGSVEQTAP